MRRSAAEQRSTKKRFEAGREEGEQEDERQSPGRAQGDEEEWFEAQGGARSATLGKKEREGQPLLGRSRKVRVD
jgi:hypothetical protein